MRLNSLRVASLGEDLQELIVGEEVEAREEQPLGLQVVLQTLLNLVQQSIVLLELLQQT